MLRRKPGRRSAALSVGAALALSATVAVAGSPTYLSSLVVDPQCADPCPVDDLAAGSVRIRSTSASGANGISVRVRLVGVQIAGAPASVPNVTVRLSLSIQGAPCATYESPAATIDGGRLRLGFTGGTTTPPLPDSLLGIMRVCEVTLAASGARFAVDGAVLRPDPA